MEISYPSFTFADGVIIEFSAYHNDSFISNDVAIRFTIPSEGEYIQKMVTTKRATIDRLFKKKEEIILRYLWLLYTKKVVN